MFKKLLFLFVGFFAVQAYSQTLWQDVSEKDIPGPAERQIIPQRYRTVRLDRAALQVVLQAAPDRFATAPEDARQSYLSIPLPDGGAARFQIMEASVMAPALQARYPEIRSYSGFSPDDPTALLKCDQTPGGFHVMLRSARWGTVFMEPYSPADTEHYVVYYKKDYLPAAKKHSFSCGLEYDEKPTETLKPIQSPPKPEAGSDGFLRRYRLALACTGEYASFHGGTKPLALAAMVTSVNRVNSVYEQEFSLTLQLIAQNDTLIFLDSASDPFNNNSGNSMLGQNQTVCNNLIGAANYDMGHVFSTGGGGIAGLGVVCTGGKARGVTGQNAPIGDPFDIDYVAHEMGHQFSGNHTQNNSCSRHGQTAMEPGSASTIMGYAGICSPNVQNNSDDYFHGVSVAEIVNYIHVEAGNTCPTLVPSGNTAPTVNAGLNYTIPKSTPFVLRAEAGDLDPGDRLTYCWEQMDSETATMPPLPTSPAGPLFRSFAPDTFPERYFPRLAALVLNASTTWERLPSVGRKMNFRVTVRDNNPAGGQTAQDDMLITVAATAGPFRVTAPNAQAIWRNGEYQVITWDVAGTDQAPIFCQAVNIRLSTDGGFTYPYLLAAGVPNNGRHCVQLPDVEALQSRIMVEAADNIFFDISDQNVVITLPSMPSFSLCLPASENLVCLPNAFSTSVSTVSLQDLDTPIELSVSGLPNGADAQFIPNPVIPGETAQMSIIFPAGLGEGVLDLQILGVVGADTSRVATQLNVVTNDFSALSLLAPANGANSLDLSPVLYWQAVTDANAYNLELATAPDFDSTTVVVFKENIAADSMKVPVLLEKGTVYYWRVRPVNDCGTGPWAGPFAFATLINVCTEIASEDVPKNITGSLAITVESTIKILANSTISDVNITRMQGNHEFFKDLEVHLISPTGTEVLLFTDKCGGFSGNFHFGFDDNGVNELTCPPVNTGALFRPAESFSKFNGENSAGNWVLRVRDKVISSGGIITGFDLEVCSNSVLFPPLIVNNNILQLAPGTNASIGIDLLKAEDQDNTDPELVYTLMSLPKHGHLELFWTGALPVGAQFTQADLNDMGLHYFNYGGTNSSDQFCFAVTDGAGGLAQGCFQIELSPVSAGEVVPGPDFVLAPNPATETVRLVFNSAPSSETRVRLFDAAGRLVHTTLLPGGQGVAALQLDRLPAGLYMVLVENLEGSGVRKLVVRK